MIANGSLSSRSSRSWDRNDQKLLSVWKKANENFETFSNGILTSEELLEEVKAEIRQSHKFTMFCVLPSISPMIPEIRKMSEKLNISDDLAKYFSARLLQTDLWTVTDNQIKANFDFLDLGDLSVRDFMSQTISLISMLSEDKPGSYDTLTLGTNRTLIRAFVGKVNQALRELTEKSLVDENRDCVFSWTHTGVINLEFQKNIKKDEYI